MINLIIVIIVLVPSYLVVLATPILVWSSLVWKFLCFREIVRCNFFFFFSGVLAFERLWMVLDARAKKLGVKSSCVKQC